MNILPHGEKISFKNPLPNNDPLLSPQEQLKDAIYKTLSVYPPEIIFNGKIYRFRDAQDRQGEKSGWYIAFDGDFPAGAYGTWHDGESHKWRADIGRSLTKEELELQKANIQLAIELEQKERAKAAKEAAEASQKTWARLLDAEDSFPYLMRKKVKNHGLKVVTSGNALVMPLYDLSLYAEKGIEAITTLQFIQENGDKRFKAYGIKAGSAFIIPQKDTSDSKITYIVEGYATGASVHEATGAEVIIAADAGNLIKVAEKLQKLNANLKSDFRFVADNDKSQTGELKANSASKILTSSSVILIPLLPNADSTDANDYAAERGLPALKEILTGELRSIIPAKEFISDNRQISYFIKSWIQRNALIMIFGASGSCKTFIALDAALSIAVKRIQYWHDDLKIHHGTVLYLNGEGSTGFKQRILGWMKAHKVLPEELNDFFISKFAMTLDDENHSSIQDIKRLMTAYEKKPDVIFIDTLNQHMQGDENKAQDTRAFLDAIRLLLTEYPDATVAVIHHTGLAQEAKGRARGSSAWRGAMDQEIEVSSDGSIDSSVIVRMTKNKDAGLAEQIYFKKNIQGTELFNEDMEEITTLVLSPSDAPLQKNELTPVEQNAYDIYKKVLKAECEFDNEGNPLGVQFCKWREAVKKDYEEKKGKKNNTTEANAFADARKGLKEKNYLAIPDKSRWNTDDKTIIALAGDCPIERMKQIIEQK